MWKMVMGDREVGEEHGRGEMGDEDGRMKQETRDQQRELEDGITREWKEQEWSDGKSVVNIGKKESGLRAP